MEQFSNRTFLLKTNLQGTFYPVGQWCSGRPVYQTSDHAEEMEEDVLCGGSEEPVLCGSSEEANFEREENRQEENIDKEAGRGERLLVRGGYWEVQVGFWHFPKCTSCFFGDFVTFANTVSYKCRWRKDRM